MIEWDRIDRVEKESKEEQNKGEGRVSERKLMGVVNNCMEGSEGNKRRQKN